MPWFCRSYSAKDVAVLAGLGVLCFPLWLSLIPNLKPGRGEARAAWAFIQVRRLQSEIVNSAGAVGAKLPSDGPAVEAAIVVTGLPEFDPWGQPFQLVTRGDGHSRIVRVFSFGPDAASTSDGLDPDDIASDMTTRPTKKFEDRRLHQWLIAFGVTGAAWFGASWLYFSTIARKREHEGASNSKPHDGRV